MTAEASTFFAGPIQAPYPGLRPFQPHESAIFFGRNEHVADMLTVLENNRFLAVVGPSGGGKSSLVLAGLIPALRRGELLTAQSKDWRFVILRPGDAPFRNLANAAQKHLWPDDPNRSFHDQDPALTELVLRANTTSFVETLRDAAVPENVNVLLVIDQFEELFRFRVQESGTSGMAATRRDDAAAFVQLLLETVKQTQRPVYVMLTMRTDFLGDCDLFDGLPQAINQSQYLTPRLNLTQLSEAITCPARQPPFSGSVAPEVVQRILNDIGSGRDELPIVQHVLFRTWQKAKERGGDTVQLTLADYEAVGGLKTALSIHADEALEFFRVHGERRLVEKVFRGLCARGPNGQQVRRPATIQQLADESHTSIEKVVSVVEAFRREDRCFLMPPRDRELTPDTKIDISHETLLRQWKALNGWLDEEARSAAIFIRLRDSAQRWEANQEAALQEPALGIAAAWQEQQQPCNAWADRYGGGLDLALKYLRASQKEHEEEAKKQEAARQRELDQAKAQAAYQSRYAKVFLAFFILAALAATWAIIAQQNLAKASKSLERLRDEKADLEHHNADLESEKQNLTTSVKALSAQEKSNQLILTNLVVQQRVLEWSNSTLNVERSRLTAEQEKLNQNIKDIEQLRTMLESNLTTLNHKETNLISAQKRLQYTNEALVTIANARGSVNRRSDGQLAVAFYDSDTLPDAALAMVNRVGDVQSVDLSRTRVSDASLEEVARIPKLESLNLSFTDISDDGIRHLAPMKQLAQLYLSETLITEAGLSDLARMKNLKTLDVSRTRVNADAVNRLRRDLPDCSIIFEPDPLLSALSIKGGDWARALKAVGGSRNDDNLEFSQSPITDATLRIVAKMADVHTLGLDRCDRITNDGLKHLQKNGSLGEIKLRQCNQITDASMEVLSRMTNLRSLKFEFIGLTDWGLRSLSRASGLTNLIIELPAGVTDDGVAEIARLSKLEHLNISYCSGLGQEALPAIAKLKNLRSLVFIDNSEVPGSAYVALRDLRQLRVLEAGYNENLTDGDLKYFEGLTQLQTLDFSSCAKVTEGGIKKLKKTLPHTDIKWSKPQKDDSSDK